MTEVRTGSSEWDAFMALFDAEGARRAYVRGSTKLVVGGRNTHANSTKDSQGYLFIIHPSNFEGLSEPQMQTNVEALYDEMDSNVAAQTGMV